MKRYIKQSLVVLAVVAAGAMTYSRVAFAQAGNVDAAKKEAKVVVYGSVPPQSMEGLHQAFKKKYGIDVEYWRGSSTQVSERALTEWRAGKPAFDIAEGNRGVQLIMKDEGLFQKFIPPASQKFPDRFKEKDALITPWRVLPISMLYNTELVKSGDIPKTFDDLLNPKWMGKISIPDPTRHTTTAQFLWNLRKFKGDKWLDYVKGLAKQKPVLVESLAPVTTTIIKGEALVGITYIKYIKQYKGPVDYIPMDQYLTDPNYLSLSAKASHPNAAKLYIDFACSPEGQKEIAEDGEFVLAPGVYPPIKDADKVAPKMVFMDNPSEEEFKKLMSGTFREIFFAK
ncbi:MAG TPA: extracellular solute-binding protein [Phototrophicaceae bacterium]|nr:extracellular solute-binding protein [Candidatus Eisenbacteria bacterium]HZH84650.1 extracellular solute-binding protein [Phototrophicaceae bacterium]